VKRDRSFLIIAPAALGVPLLLLGISEIRSGFALSNEGLWLIPVNWAFEAAPQIVVVLAGAIFAGLRRFFAPLSLLLTTAILIWFWCWTWRMPAQADVAMGWGLIYWPICAVAIVMVAIIAIVRSLTHAGADREM
jgi:hypothetical protein